MPMTSNRQPKPQPAPQAGRATRNATGTRGDLSPTPIVLACMIAMAGAMLPAAHAQQAGAGSARTALAAQRQIDLPTQPLGQTLSALAREWGVSVLMDSALDTGKSAPAVRGHVTLGQALDRALAGSGLAATPSGSAITVHRGAAQESATLAPVVVTAQAERSGTTEGTGSYTQAGPSSTATRLGLTQRETPQSVSVITRQQIEDQGAQSIEDVLLNTTGMTTGSLGGGDERTQFFSRGFEVSSVMADGLRLSYDTETTTNATLAIYDRVEVLRGAAGLMVGAGNPSGTINLMRKRPTAERQVSLTGSIGSWNNYRGELDASGPLNSAGTLRGRTVIAYQDTDTFKKAQSHQRTLVYGVLEADLGPKTLLSVGGYYNNEDNPGSDWNGLPVRADGSFYPFDRSARMSPDWAYWNKQNSSIFAELEHGFDNEWKTKIAARAVKAGMDMAGTAFWAENNGILQGSAGAYQYDNVQYSLDGNASGPFQLFGRTHELAIGGSIHKKRIDDGPGGWPTGYSLLVDPLTWDSSADVMPSFNSAWSRKGHQKQQSAYGTARFSLTDPLHVIAGARVDWLEYSLSTQSGSWLSNAAYKATREITPYAALTYDMGSHHTGYVSWTSVFSPQQDYPSASGFSLDPVTGKNVEIGIKGEYFGGTLNASAALFKINQTNLAKSLDISLCAAGLTSCYEGQGEVESKGIDFEIAGALMPNWQASLGYTYNTSKYVKDSTGGNAGSRYNALTPRNLLKITTSYRLPGALSNWRIGGAVRSQSEFQQDFGAKSVSARQGGYTLVDLMVSWQVSRNLDLLLNVNNVTDKYYYKYLGSWSGQSQFGAPRNWLLTAKYRF